MNKFYKHIIFDFDETLINRSISDKYRKNKDWNKVYEMIPQFTFYFDLEKVFDFLTSNDYQITIVSHCKKLLIEKTAKHFKIPYNHIVVPMQWEHKPNPKAFFKALKLMNCNADDVISFGDSLVDFQAAKAAGIDTHIACLWGNKNDEQLLKENGCQYFIEKPTEIINFLIKNRV